MNHQTINVALVGAGWAGDMHAKAYEHVYGVNVERKVVCALEPTLPEFAARHGFLSYTDDFDAVLRDPEIDVVDIVTPPNLHKSMVITALRAGKHVVCEKPLTGYFGTPGDPERVGNARKDKMLQRIQADMAEIEEALLKSGKQFFYAENWLYAPAFLRACQLIQKKGTTVMQMSGVAGHKGSHADYVRYWSKSGGGAATRNLIHPVGAALYLKRLETNAKGLPYGVASVYCDCSKVTEHIDKRHIAASPVDVEDFSHMVLTFADGTKATLTAADLYLGQATNTFEIYGNDAVFRCNYTPNNLLDAYFSDDRGIEDEQIIEKSDHNLGRQHALVADELVRGYYGEIQDFMECVRDGREPLSGFALAKEAMEIVSLGYCSAEQGRLIELNRPLL